MDITHDSDLEKFLVRGGPKWQEIRGVAGIVKPGWRPRARLERSEFCMGGNVVSRRCDEPRLSPKSTVGRIGGSYERQTEERRNRHDITMQNRRRIFLKNL